MTQPTFTPLSPSSPPPSADISLPQIEPEGSHWGKAHHVLLLFLAIVLAVWILSGFYTVNADEEAIVERLGQYVTNDKGDKALVVDQGLHYHLPWPIDLVHKVPIKQALTLQVRTFNASPDNYKDFTRDLIRKGASIEQVEALFDPYLITADKNVVHMEIAVVYQIAEPEKWLMTVSHNPESADKSGTREELFNQVAAHVMIAQLAHMPVDNVLIDDRERLPQILMNKLVDAMKIHNPGNPKEPIDLGISIQKVDVTALRPPDVVLPSFEAVLQSRADKEIAKRRAEAKRDSDVNFAEGQHRTMIGDAQAYASQVVDAATGDASRFSQVYTEFQNAPDITRWRLYSDAAQSITANAKQRLFVEPGQKSVLYIDPPQFDAGQATPK